MDFFFVVIYTHVVFVEIGRAHLGSKSRILVSSFSFSLYSLPSRNVNTSLSQLQIQYEYSKHMHFSLSRYHVGQCLRFVHFEPFPNLGLMYNMQSVFSLVNK